MTQALAHELTLKLRLKLKLKLILDIYQYILYNRLVRFFLYEFLGFV